MTTYKTNYYRDTAHMLMREEVDLTEVNQVTEAYKLVLDSILQLYSSEAPDIGRLNIVGANAVEYAQHLIIQQKAVETGQLHSSVGYSVFQGEHGPSLEIFASAVNPWGRPYGQYIEYGYHPYGRSKMIPPRPFLRPALDFALTNTRKNIEDSLVDIFSNIKNGKYEYNLLNKTVTLGNRALAANAQTRGTTGNKPFGAPTSKAVSSLSNRLSQYEKSRKDYGGWSTHAPRSNNH